MVSAALALSSEDDLIAVARHLGADGAGLSRAESELLAACARRPDARAVNLVRGELTAGRDPLGEAFCRIRSPVVRRMSGATYTPDQIIAAMLDWAASQPVAPKRIVDPGAGSGRFLMAAAERFPSARLIAIETDPLAMVLLRANAAVRGFADRLEVRLEDYRSTRLAPIGGPTVFIGNPPYVRHHAIDGRWKDWFAALAARRGLKASKLAGLHVHFFLQTAQLAQSGDYGAFVTAAEWLDVNYGSIVRAMLADGLGGESLHVLDPAALPFEDTATTAAITCFRSGCRSQTLRVRNVASPADLGDLSAGSAVAWETLALHHRWSVLVRGGPPKAKGQIEVGELFRVNRGQVTGCNAIWIEGPHSQGIPSRYLFPSVTRAKNLFVAGEVLADTRALRRVIDLPVCWDRDPALTAAERRSLEEFLLRARALGAAEGYIARHRAAWHSVGLKPPAPILCTYMARRPPAFVRNVAGARHINIAHGLYPREPLPESTLRAIVAWLRVHVGVEAGRTYAGGLTKFEPGEVARLSIPARLVKEGADGPEKQQQVAALLG